MGHLVIGVPSKGRLQQQTIELLSAAGIAVEKRGNDRTYQGFASGAVEAEVKFLSASEITTHLANGSIHLGVTGEDLLRENLDNADAITKVLQPLGFGFADVVVAVPEFWHDVVTMADLNDVAATFRSRHGRRMRIATKYWTITQRFFTGNGIDRYRIVESLGATEGAPASGSADIIVDITTTGETLRANGLRVLEDGVMLRSQAMLIQSKTAPTDDAQQTKIETVSALLRQAVAER